jgi:hypothetical protein
MTDQESTSPDEPRPDRPVPGAGSGPPAPATTAEQGRPPAVRRLLSNRRTGWIVAAALMCAVVGLSVALALSPSTAAGHAAPGNSVASGSGNGGSNARSGPASGGASGTVDSVTASSFTMSTSAGQQVTVDEVSSTTYQNGASSTGASGITAGENVLVLGTTNGTTITAAQVVGQPTDGGGAAASSAAGVVPFQRGAPTTSKQVGSVPADYSEGSGTIVSGTPADEATEAALAAYPGGVVDRVVRLSGGEYEVHYIGVNWPHHIFVDPAFTVVGAE